MYGFSTAAKANVIATFAINATESSVIETKDVSLTGIQMPAAWTAADITFQGSIDGGTTYAVLYNLPQVPTISTAVEVYTIKTPVAAKFHPVDSRIFDSMTHIKIVSSTAQLTARSFQVATRNKA